MEIHKKHNKDSLHKCENCEHRSNHKNHIEHCEKCHENHNMHHSHDHHNHHSPEIFKRKFLISLLLTIPVVLLSDLFSTLTGLYVNVPYETILEFLLSSIVFFYGGSVFLKGMYHELKNKEPGMMTLIGLAISVAYLYSTLVTFNLVSGKTFFWELTTLIVVMLLGHWIEMKSVESTRKILEHVLMLLPKTAKLIRDDKIIEISIDDLKPGDIVLIRPGEKIPLDGVIIEGETSVDESLVTGESKPVTKRQGDYVIGGSKNIDGLIKVKITKKKEESYVFEIKRTIEDILSKKTRIQDVANRFARYLTYVAISAAVISFIYWYNIKGVDFALERAVTTMVIACPHALGLAIPLALTVSTSKFAKHGIIIKNRDAIEKLSKANVVLLDKTGTITTGEFLVSNIRILEEDYTVEDIIKIAASLERFIDHPIAKAISKLTEDYLNVSNVKILPGKGVKGIVNGEEYLLGNEKLLEELNIKIQEKPRSSTVVYVIENNKLIAIIELEDKIKDDAKETIKLLKSLGLEVYIVTGDKKKVAKKVAEELNVSYYAEVLPKDKAKIVRRLQDNKKIVVFAGDGINDAPALLQADVGIAFGTLDLTLESADVIVTNNRLKSIYEAIILFRKTYKKFKENLFWAAGYNIVAIPLATGILGITISPAVGALLMSLSTVIVAINSRIF